MNNILYIIIFSFLFSDNNLNPFSFVKFPFSVKQEISFGYEDNFMRFSDLEMESYNFESNTDNDYLGDSKYYDSAIISPSIQILLKPKLIKNKTNFTFKIKYNEYTSSNQKSYLFLSARSEVKLAPYSWVKFSYSLVPRYYLRTFIDRDLTPLNYFLCDFSNENTYLSISYPFLFKKTWLEIKATLNNQFYNENFTEYDTQVYGFESYLKSNFFKRYFLSLGFLYANANNLSYDINNQTIGTRMDRSYSKYGLFFQAKKTLKNTFISSMSFKFKANNRFYDLNSWYYEADNWKNYFEKDITIDLTKKINRKAIVQLSYKYFKRDVKSSQSNEIIWVEDYKVYDRNEFWLRFIFNFSKK